MEKLGVQEKEADMIQNITQEFLNMIKLPDSDGKHLRYLFVMPVLADLHTQYPFPIGLAMVSSALKASGRDVYTINLTYKEKYQEILENIIKENKIDVLLTGGLSGQYGKLREILEIAKSVNPAIITVVGGGIITAEPEVAMQALAQADYGVLGEGEIVVNEIAYALEHSGDALAVDGVITNSNIKDSYLQYKEIANLDILPFPDYDGFDFAECVSKNFSGKPTNIYYGFSLAGSRSCPFQCTFCFHSSGKRYRRRSIENVTKELDYVVKKYNLTVISFADELFGADLEYVRELCQRIKPYGLTFWVQTHIKMVSEEYLKILKESGCTHLTLGVEHINDTVLKSMKKDITLKDIEWALAATKRAGLVPIANILFGDLAETAETIREALDWWGKNQEYQISLNWILTFPGAYIYKEACRMGRINDPVQFLRDGCPMVNITQMSDAEWNSMQKEVSHRRIIAEMGDGVDDELVEHALLEIVKKEKVAVWPAINDTMLYLYKVAPMFCNSANVFWVNMNPDTQWLKTSGFNFNAHIQTPDVVFKYGDIETVICTRSNLMDEIMRTCNTFFPCVKRVQSIAELAKEYKDSK